MTAVKRGLQLYTVIFTLCVILSRSLYKYSLPHCGGWLVFPGDDNRQETPVT